MDRELLQERFRGDAWKIGVSCIMLNQTTREQVDAVLDKLLLYWPTPEIMSEAVLKEVAGVIESTGFGWTKAYRLIRMSDEYLSWDGQRESAQLFGFGPYALDSLDIFYFDVPPMMVLDVESGEARIASGDKELLAYLSRTMVS